MDLPRTATLQSLRHHDTPGPRRAVNLSLSEELVTQARGLTKNLSATVETLLAEYVRQETLRRQAADAELEAVIDALNAHHAKHGLLSDEFPSL